MTELRLATGTQICPRGSQVDKDGQRKSELTVKFMTVRMRQISTGKSGEMLYFVRSFVAELLI